MIHLVLNAGCQQAVARQFLRLAVIIKKGNAALGWTRDIIVKTGYRQAALLIIARFFRRPDNFGIYEKARARFARIGFFRIVLRRTMPLLAPTDIHHDHAVCHAHLNGRQTNAIGVIHGIQHVIHQGARVVGYFRNGLRNGFQPLVRHFDNRSNCHDFEISPAAARVKRTHESDRLGACLKMLCFWDY